MTDRDSSLYSRTARKSTPFGHDRKGTAMVELAFSLPFIFLLLIGVVDIARAFSTGATVANAARAGAQYGVQNATSSGDTAKINLAARQDGVDAGAVTVTSSRVCRCSDGSIVDCVTGSCSGYGAPRVYVVVTAASVLRTLIDYPGLPRNMSISRTATLRLQ